MSLRVLDHPVDIRLRKAAGRLYPNGLLLAGSLVLGRDVDDTVGVDVEGDFDLRQAAWRSNAHQVELAEQLVVRRHFTFALEDANGHGALVILGSRKGLALLRRNGGIALDQP
jgi:hypothetical protein